MKVQVCSNAVYIVQWGLPVELFMPANTERKVSNFLQTNFVQMTTGKFLFVFYIDTVDERKKKTNMVIRLHNSCYLWASVMVLNHS